MKFELCGNDFAPAWLVAEIVVLSNFALEPLRSLCEEVCSNLKNEQVCSNLKKETKDQKEGKTNMSLLEETVDGVDKPVDSSDLAACKAVVHFIITNSAKYKVEKQVLHEELLQLGLPESHSKVLCKIHADSCDEIREVLYHQTSMYNTLSGEREVQFRVDSVLASKADGEGLNVPIVNLGLPLDLTGGKQPPLVKGSFKPQEDVKMLKIQITEQKFHVLFHELLEVKRLML